MENNISQPQPVKRNLPRDVFLHLFAVVALYWSAISFITLCWQYINYFFPDVLQDYGYMGFAGPIRFAISSLIIIFPLFILVSWLLNNIYIKETAVRGSKIRKWLIYLTLFIAALVIVGDLVAVINVFLGGEVTARFVLKALSVLAVAAVIFWYYLDDVRRDTPTSTAKYFAWATSVVMGIAVVGAFFIIGSPANARLYQFDQQKVNDLQNIQSQVVSYWQRKQALPKTLAELEDPISGYVAPQDPQTGDLYEYTIKDVQNLTFELCATFNLEKQTDNMRGKAVPAMYSDMMYQNWNHGTGRVCFERQIDKELYAPFTNPK